MKKITAMLTAILLCLAMCIQVMAADVMSPVEDVIALEGTITLSDGTVINVTDPETMKQYLTIVPAENAAEPVEGYTTLKTFDVKFSANVSSADVVLYVPGVKAGDTITVRMLIDGQWVTVEAVVIGDNKIRVKIPGSGTMQVLKKESSGSNTTPGDNTGNTSGNTTGSNTSSTSPKTGENSAFPMACAAFAVFAVVALTAGYKAKKISE